MEVDVAWSQSERRTDEGRRMMFPAILRAGLVPRGLRMLSLPFSLVLLGALPQNPAPNIGRLAAVVDPFLKQNRVPGLSLAVVREGELILATGFGATSPSEGESVTGDTRFRIASVTKALTAIVILQLASEGKLALDDQAGARCPAFSPAGGNPTLGELLAHQGGVRHPTDEEDTTIRGEYPRLAAAVARLSGEKLRFRPGTDVLYSSWGYAVLGCAIEEATGQSYFDTVRARILKPAGMVATVPDRSDFAAPDFSRGFRLQNDKLVPSLVVDTRFKQAASGLICSASDLARLALALYQGKLLPQAGQQLLFSPKTTRKGKATDFSLGLLVGRDRRWGQAFYHGGSMEGTTALLYLIPERRYAVALLANRERFAREVASLLPQLNETILGPAQR
jgi:CubicO group peptidase (beta-lactamase class C family)